MSKRIEIGPYSAYALAVKYGYTGTEEEWVNETEEKRKSAAASAETAANSAAAATGKAEEAAASAAEAARAAREAGEMARVAEGSASSAAGSAAAASTSASSAAGSAEAAQRNANAAEGSARGAADTLADVERRLSLGELKGEKGDPGEQGPQGETGPEGAPGQAASVAVGAVKTLNYYEPATVENTGTEQNAVFSFGIPQGAPAFDRTAALASGDPKTIDLYYRQAVNEAGDVKAVNLLFVDWWTSNWDPSTSTYNGMLWRWFENVLVDNRTHGVRFPLFSTSNTAIGELTDDSVGLSCTPSTAAQAGQDDFAGLPQFWCVEVAAEKNADGTHTIYACQYIDDDDLVRDSNHLVWVLQKNTYTRERNENGYRILKMHCYPSSGYNQWPQGTDRQGTVYPYMANPKYFAGIQEDGIIGNHTGLAPVNFTSHNQGVALWRKRGSQYAGASGALLKWQLRMMWLKYARKGNSGTIEGCSQYNFQYTAAFSAEGVSYFPLSAAQAANLLVDSWVQVGTHVYNGETATSNDRNTSYNYDIIKNARIARIEDITVDDVAYKAVYLDTAATWDVVAGQTLLSATPYGSGYNDTVKGNDGSRTNYTNGKEPGLIQKTEFQNGAYLIVADELWQWGKDEDGNYTFDIYTCHDQTKITTNGTISADYTKQEELTLTFPAGTGNSWQYIEDTALSDDPAVLWPAAVSNRAGSGTGVKAGFYVYPAASGVRGAWRCSNLNLGGYCSLAAADSIHGPSFAGWSGGVGAPDLAG